MLLGIGKIIFLLFIGIIAYFVSDILWLKIPHNKLLSVLWKFSFVAAVCSTIGYQLRNRLNEVVEHEFLNVRETRRLTAIVNNRRSRITVFVIFGVILSILLAMATLINYVPIIAEWYFKGVVCALSVQITLFIFTLVSFREVDDFKDMLSERKKKYDERKRLLNKINDKET